MAYIVSSGNKKDGINLENDSMTILSHGLATNTTVNTGGVQTISSGGSTDNSLADYCKKHKIGFVLSETTTDSLQELIANGTKLHELQNNAFHIYNQFFSKEIICSKWNNLINSLERQ